MNYLDTNIIVYAIENHPKYGKPCKKILEDIYNKKQKACSSFLVLIELINVLVKLNRTLPEEKQLNIRKNIEAVTSLPIIWLDIDLFILERAAEYTYRVSGVDYIHIALMEVNMVSSVISADTELDKISFIKRIDPLSYETNV